MSEYITALTLVSMVITIIILAGREIRRTIYEYVDIIETPYINEHLRHMDFEYDVKNDNIKVYYRNKLIKTMDMS